MKHPLTDRFDHSADVLADIAARVPDTTDHLAGTTQIINTYHPRRLTLKVTEVIPETPTTKTFRLSRPDNTDLPPFLAGQYVALFADGTNRPYAIASSPARLSHYDLTIRRVLNGRISNLLLDELSVGDTVTTSGPMGTFHHNPLFHGNSVVFLAGGSGVVPAMSMIRDIVDHGLDRRLHLIYGSRDESDIIFFDELAVAHPNITVDHVIGDLLTSDVITALAGPLDNRMVYVCGPQQMYPFALEQLTALGHPRRRIRFEANGAPADPTSQPHWPADADPTEQVTVTARGRTFRTPRNRPLLDALEDNGIQPESACRSGECSLCRVRVCSGTVHNASEAKLRLTDAAYGYTHSCVAYPLTDVDLDV
ncbi:putative oxidoreductase [Lentzea sp. NBRC 105346]|uniref:FAD-binding oxidoreductase n=1 Tax=Lentzea sp. NBRC 105346 TaxID=3032205 RepID=UPI0024A1DDB9|nr:FAD-binding oxidoreductase [Lentzea sp. NBRC 105346]GLZ30073.1 putative oxidoreductase [Lentzea sp. NBRC 105346]